MKPEARFYKTKRNHHEHQLNLARKALDNCSPEDKIDLEKAVDKHEQEYINYAKAYQGCLLG